MELVEQITDVLRSAQVHTEVHKILKKTPTIDKKKKPKTKQAMAES